MNDRKRIDLPADPYIRLTERVRDPHRVEATPTISSTQPQQRMRVSAYNNTLFAVPNGVLVTTSIPLDTEFIDTAGLHDNVTNNTRITIPSQGKITGLWLFHGVILWTGDAAGTTRVAKILQNDLLRARMIMSPVANDQSHDVWWFANDPSAADYFELAATQNAGHAVDVFANLEAIHLW